MISVTSLTPAELAAELRPPLLRLTRVIRNQRVDISVTLTQLSAMATLHRRGSLSAGELAACEKVQPPSMTKVLANLEERGLVVRAPHPGDKRQAILSLTDAGVALLDLEGEARNAWLSQHLAALTADERFLLHQVTPLLEKLADL